jgi:hypothetical protein
MYTCTRTILAACALEIWSSIGGPHPDECVLHAPMCFRNERHCSQLVESWQQYARLASTALRSPQGGREGGREGVRGRGGTEREREPPKDAETHCQEKYRSGCVLQAAFVLCAQLACLCVYSQSVYDLHPKPSTLNPNPKRCVYWHRWESTPSALTFSDRKRATIRSVECRLSASTGL